MPVDLEVVPPILRKGQYTYDVQNDRLDKVDINSPTHERTTEDVQAKQPVEEIPTISLRRFTRTIQTFTKYSVHDYIFQTDMGEPECYEMAIKDDNKDEWIEAIQDKMHSSLYKNHTFELVKSLEGRKALKNKLVFRIKH